MSYDLSSTGVFVMAGLAAFGQVVLMAFVVGWICYRDGPCAKRRATQRDRVQMAYDRTEHMDPADTEESDDAVASSNEVNVPISEPPHFLVSTWIVSVAERIRRVNYVTRSRQAEEGLRLSVLQQAEDDLPSYHDAISLPVYSQVVESAKVSNLPPPPKYEDVTRKN